jgi:hypothetical protein
VDAAEREERMRTLVVFPEWGGREVVPRSIDISPQLRDRFRAWNETWQVVLDPIFEIRWPDPEVGREWIAEGNALVRDLQREVGPDLQVTGDFAAYDPDASEKR